MLNQPAATAVSNADTIQTAARTPIGAPPKVSSAAANEAGAKTVTTAADAPIEASEKVYFCGAETKKGTLCTHRVKGGGRCWQHVGQTAMLAQEKLLVSQ